MPASAADEAPGVVVVFAKAPRPGLVKTRLCPPLLPDQAADLYQHLLEDVLETTGQFALESGFDAVLTVYPEDARSELAARAPRNFRVIAQHGSGLGDRMAWALDEAIAGGAARVLLRGSDNPALPRDHLHAAADALLEDDVVVAPDLDGGYGLIGFRGAWSAVFDHPMSTQTVLEETLANARRLGLRVQQLAPTFDVDDASDLTRLARAYENGELDGCARTVGWIRDNGLVSGL